MVIVLMLPAAVVLLAIVTADGEKPHQTNGPCMCNLHAIARITGCSTGATLGENVFDIVYTDVYGTIHYEQLAHNAECSNTTIAQTLPVCYFWDDPGRFSTEITRSYEPRTCEIMKYTGFFLLSVSGVAVAALGLMSWLET